MKNTRLRALAAAPFLALCAMACLAQIPQDYPSGYRKLITSAQREGRVGCPVLRHISEHNVCSSFSKAGCNRKANTAATTSHNGNTP